MVKQHVWYCESVKNHLHAFCLLRSPYKTSIKKKVIELSEGHGFLEWTLIKLTPEKANEFFQHQFNCDELYVGEKPQTVH